MLVFGQELRTVDMPARLGTDITPGMFARSFRNMAGLRTRYEARDRCADLKIFMPVIKAIDEALTASKRERDALGRRVANLLSDAAVLAGNGTDEYVERDVADAGLLKEYESEITNGRKRLEQLDYAIAQFEWLKTETTERFSAVLSAKEH